MADPVLAQYFDADAQWVSVYRALVRLLQTDDTLSRVVRSWDVRVGAQNETQPPSREMLPWVAVVPLDFDMQPESEGEDRGMFRIRIDFGVPGTHWNDLGNMAGAVRAALLRNKKTEDGTTVYAVFDRAGANNYWADRAGVGVRRTESPPTDTGVSATPPVIDQFGSAVYRFQLLLPDATPGEPLY